MTSSHRRGEWACWSTRSASAILTAATAGFPSRSDRSCWAATVATASTPNPCTRSRPKRAPKPLPTLSTETGAKTYIIREAGDGEALRKACENISLELREQYTIGFLAPDPSAGGYRSLKV